MLSSDVGFSIPERLMISFSSLSDRSSGRKSLRLIASRRLLRIRIFSATAFSSLISFFGFSSFISFLLSSSAFLLASSSAFFLSSAAFLSTSFRLSSSAFRAASFCFSSSAFFTASFSAISGINGKTFAQPVTTFSYRSGYFSFTVAFSRLTIFVFSSSLRTPNTAFEFLSPAAKISFILLYCSLYS